MTVKPTIIAMEKPAKGMKNLVMNAITSISASFATKTLWATPGLKRAGVVEQTIAAAAIAGLKPARIKIGIKDGPTAAQRPAVEGIATAQKLVTTLQAGRRNTPSLRSGLVSRATK